MNGMTAIRMFIMAVLACLCFGCRQTIIRDQHGLYVKVNSFGTDVDLGEAYIEYSVDPNDKNILYISGAKSESKNVRAGYNAITQTGTVELSNND